MVDRQEATLSQHGVTRRRSTIKRAQARLVDLWVEIAVCRLQLVFCFETTLWQMGGLLSLLDFECEQDTVSRWLG